MVCESLLDEGHVEVAEERFRGGDDGEVGVVAVVGHREGGGEGGCGADGKGGGEVEIGYYCLWEVISFNSNSRNEGRKIAS